MQKYADGLTVKEVNRQAVLFEESCKSGQVSSTVKFETFAEEWFEEYAKLNLKSTTLTRSKQLTKRTYKAIGHIRLDKLTARDIQKFINSLAKDGTNELTGKPLAYKTMKHYLSFISTVIDYAIKMDMLTDKFDIYSGMRRGELLGLEWKDIDFDTGIIHIQRTSNYTKTREKLVSQWIETDRLFIGWNGAPMGNNTPYDWLRRYCKNTGFRFCDVHSMRHFNASVLINSGIDAVTVSSALGHSAVGTTTGIYLHVFQEYPAKKLE